MAPAHLPKFSSEFPNDNPLLSRGVRWVCQGTLGVARAVVRSGGERTSQPLPSPEPLAEPEPARSPSFEGPLDIDPGRVVLRQRELNVPPPPDFVFEPFRCEAPRQAAEPLPAEPDGGVVVLPCVVVTAPTQEAEAAPPPAAEGCAASGTRPSPRRASGPSAAALQTALAELEAAFR